MLIHRNDCVGLHRIGNEYFALLGTDGSCHILNETGGWLLELAEHPVTVDRLIACARERFPDVQASQLELDIREALEDFAVAGLVDTPADVPT